jgi:hypothetical protein
VVAVIRTQVQFTEEQARRLRRMARERGVSVAELVRRCVDHALQADAGGREALVANALRLVGAFRDRGDATDVAERHDDYLYKAFE